MGDWRFLFPAPPPKVEERLGLLLPVFPLLLVTREEVEGGVWPIAMECGMMSAGLMHCCIMVVMVAVVEPGTGRASSCPVFITACLGRGVCGGGGGGVG